MRPLFAFVRSILIGVLVTSATAEAASRTIYLDASGQLIGTAPVVTGEDTIRICIAGGHAKALKVHYKFTAAIENLELLDPAGKGVKPLKYCDPDDAQQKPGDVEEIQVSGPGFILYNVVGPAVRALTPEPLKLERKNKLATANTALDQAKKDLEAAKTLIATLTEEIKQLGAGTSLEATNAIIARQQQIAMQRPIQKTAEDNVKSRTSEIEGLLKETALDDTPPTRAIYRLGAVLVGDARRQVSYRLARDGTAQQPLRLELVGTYPVLLRDDELFAVVVNVQPSMEPSQFRLTFASEIAKPPDPAPVRPTVDQSKLGAGPTRNHKAEAEMATAYADYFMTVGRPLKANEIIKTTITAYSTNVTTDKTTETDGTKKHEVVTETTNVKLIDAVEYPQVHDRYHYNITTGVISSALKDPVFTKIKSVVGAADADTRYRVDKNDGNWRVFPVLLFSFYWTPKDIQVPWRGADLVPVPSIGFSLASPADNFFVGFQSEIRRNVQLVYGLHYGKVTRVIAVPVDDDRNSTAPNTRKAFGRSGFVGLSFNVNFVKDLFK